MPVPLAREPDAAAWKTLVHSLSWAPVIAVQGARTGIPAPHHHPSPSWQLKAIKTKLKPPNTDFVPLLVAIKCLKSTIKPIIMKFKKKKNDKIMALEATLYKSQTSVFVLLVAEH